MKKQTIFLILLFLITLTLKAQNLNKISADSLELYKTAYKLIKSEFDKPVYNYIYENYEPQKVFTKINLSNIEMAEVFDSLQANSSISINKTKYGNVVLNLLARFPISFNYNDLGKIGRISILECKLYNGFNKKFEIKTFENANFKKLKPEYENGKLVTNNYIYGMLQTYLEDTTEIDPFCNGTAKYKISFISNNFAINANKSDILKSYSIDNDTIKLIDVFENKVVIEYLHIKLCDFHGYLQNTDSMGRRAKTKTESIENYSKTTLDKVPINYANEGNFTMPKEIYELFKNNPEVTFEEFISKAIAVEKSESIPFYEILHSPAPINHNFIINSPVYGFDREFEVKLANKTAKASAKK